MEKIKQIIKDLQDKGLPIIMLQDVITKKPSITFTFFVLSGIMCLLAAVDVKILSELNFDEALKFFDACSMVYVGRSAVKALTKTEEKKEEGE